MNWFYTRGGQKYGPVSDAELRQLAASGSLQPNDLVWREDMKDWRAAGSIKGLCPQTVAVKQHPNLPPLPSELPPALPNGSRHKSPVVIGMAAGGFLMMMVLCSGVLGFLGGDETRRSRDTKETPAEDVIMIPSNQLFAEYKENDIAADRKYKGQILEVSGSVENISRDILDNIYVTLKAGQFEFFSIQCFFADSFEDQAAELRPGQHLTIRGRCDGKLGNVMLKDCIIK